MRLVPDPDVSGVADAPIEMPPGLEVGVVTVPQGDRAQPVGLADCCIRSTTYSAMARLEVAAGRRCIADAGDAVLLVDHEVVDERAVALHGLRAEPETAAGTSAAPMSGTYRCAADM